MARVLLSHNTDLYSNNRQQTEPVWSHDSKEIRRLKAAFPVLCNHLCPHCPSHLPCTTTITALAGSSLAARSQAKPSSFIHAQSPIINLPGHLMRRITPTGRRLLCLIKHVWRGSWLFNQQLKTCSLVSTRTSFETYYHWRTYGQLTLHGPSSRLGYFI